VNLLFAQIHAKAAKTAANHDEHQQFYWAKYKLAKSIQNSKYAYM
jgi:hypothetical protein